MSQTAVVLVSRDSSLALGLKKEMKQVVHLPLHVCQTLDEAVEWVNNLSYSLILLHTGEGMDEEQVLRFLQATMAAGDRCSVIVLSEEYHSGEAVAMMRSGATEYCVIPQDLPKLPYMLDILTIRHRGLDSQEGIREPELRCEQDSATSFVLDPDIVGVLGKIRRVVLSNSSILITGETGSGKTHLARVIHELSPRSSEPFIVVDCPTLAPNLVESQLFGHVKGAFTGAEKEREGKFAVTGAGTIVLDDINALPLTLQAKLLRVVDERVFEPVGSNEPKQFMGRVIAISNRSLPDEVDAGRFRADLYHRLNVIGIHVPPLRERPAAIVPLANRFLACIAERNRRNLDGFTPDALEFLRSLRWPGNVRELQNLVVRAVLMADGPRITLKDVQSLLNADAAVVRSAEGQRNDSAHIPHLVPKNGHASEKEELLAALARNNNNRARAAKELGISRMGLYKRMRKHGLIEPKSDKQ